MNNSVFKKLMNNKIIINKIMLLLLSQLFIKPILLIRNTLKLLFALINFNFFIYKNIIFYEYLHYISNISSIF